jgi:hypothetical protein
MRMNKTKALAITGLLVFGLSSASNAYAMRCGTRLISKGDHMSKILKYCGEPDITQSRSAQRSYHNRYGHVLYAGFYEEVLIQEWTYNLGPNKLMRIIKLENGVVRGIEHLGYGYTKR